MTNEEAIKVLKNIGKHCKADNLDDENDVVFDSDFVAAWEMSIAALEKLKEKKVTEECQRDMNNTMGEFIYTIDEINKLEEKKQQIRKRFTSSTEELSECFQYIIGAKLEGRNNCSLTIDTCSELYAKKLKEIGFEVKENRNVFGTLCGYRISWTI